MEELIMYTVAESSILGVIGIAIVAIFSLIIKDVLSSAAFGFLFYLDKSFNEGDNVYINGEHATIVKISITRSIFKMHETNRWKYVHNSKIRDLDLEKVVEPNEK